MGETFEKIRIVKLPKNLYEFTWEHNGKPGHLFLTEAKIISKANNGRVYRPLREFLANFIRRGFEV